MLIYRFVVEDTEKRCKITQFFRKTVSCGKKSASLRNYCVLGG
jgi:hypothetical protein